MAERGGRVKRARRDADERRAELVELGLEHFGTAPYDDISIDAIAAAAGISKGLLYHYFPTKKAFYVECVRLAASQIEERIDKARAALPEAASPIDELVACLDAYLDYVRAHGPAYTTLLRSGVGVDREIAEIVDETRELFLARLTESIDEAPLKKKPDTLELALRGWIGMVEAVSLGWIEIAERRRISVRQVRDLLTGSLIAILGLGS